MLVKITLTGVVEIDILASIAASLSLIAITMEQYFVARDAQELIGTNKAW